MRAQVYQQRTEGAAIAFTATLKNYQYGDVCFSAVPPAGQTTQEADSGGLPSVSNPGNDLCLYHYDFRSTANPLPRTAAAMSKM